MLTKFETKGGRVKGLSFHSKLPWILASLHNGVIQLWDYRMGTLVARFLDHDGPVRAVHFHKSQPLFVSGGDDYKVKVWNYKLRRCLFTLTGHQDYVRTVEFHHVHPWIVSASDDQTIRIWNWQSRTCVSVLTGHSHYVMCASFHPKDDLLVSASFDQTIRVWDISALRQITVSPPDDDILSLFCVDAVDPVVIYVLEGHNRGVNWVSFHPTSPLMFSCGDDRRVKIWRMNETKASEVGTLSGHMNNVSCVLYLARQDVIVSNSEDKTIRVWDATKREPLQTFSRENDRFWILTAHPEMNLLAAGHDSGMMVFKLERERPAFSATNDNLLYVKDRFLRAYEYSTQKDIQLIPIRRPGSNTVNQSPPRTLSYSPTENAVLISSDMDGGSYELHIVPKNGSDAVQDPKKGSGSSAVFVARNRFAVLEKSSNQVVVKNLQNSKVKESNLPIPTDAITYAGTGKVLCRAEQEVIIFDLQQRIVLGELQIPSIRHVVWSHDMESVALLSKHSVVIADKKLARRCTLREIVHVKSGAWDNNGVFIYTTLTQIKYCLPNGDSATIKTLDFPVYITKIVGNTIFCLDRNGKNRPIIIDSTEYIIKLCLLRKDYDQVMKMINSSQLCGQAVIAYLQQKGFPEAALHFVKDERTRFNLALECGNIEIAIASAKEMDEEDHWYRLGVEALRQGNIGIAEYAYLRTRSFGRLSFLYLIAGNLEKLSKMMKIAKANDDFMDQFHGSLYTGNKEESVRILQNAGLSPLAYITATVHGLGEAAERIAAELKEEAPCLPNGKTASLLAPPKPVLSGGDWPLLTVTRGIFHGLENAAPGEYEEEDADWAENMQISGDDEEVHEEEGGWDIEDLDLPADDLDTASSSSSSVFVAPARGIPASQIRVQKSSLAGEHAAAGNFDTAMSLLNRQLGITNFTPLKKLFIDLHSASHSYLHPFPSAPVFTAAVERGWGTAFLGFPQLEEKRDAGYKATTDGNFPDAIKTFLSILHAIPLTVVETQSQVEEVEKLITIARDYVLGLQMEVKRKQSMPIRQLELAAYFTHCNNLLPHHRRLTLWNAMSLAYKAKRMSLAANFASRFLDTNPTDENKAGNARKVVEAAERVHHNNMRDDELKYDLRNPFVVCGATYVPIYRGQNDVACPYCSAHFVPGQQGQLCNVCHLAAVGAPASGLLCSPSQVR